MIYSFTEQVIMSVKFMMIGMFVGIMMDTAYILNFKKKLPNIIVQLGFWVIMTIIICTVMLRISDGYIPLYTFLFFIIGYSIYYYFFKKSYIKTLNKIKNIYNKNYRKALDVIFPREIFRFFGRLVKKICKKTLILIKLIFTRKKRKAVDTEENLAQTLLNNANEINI